MANTIDWGQAAVNNTNGFGKAPTNNTIDFGEICADSWSPETNLTGTGATPSFLNTKSIALDGIDDFVNLGSSNNLNFTGDFTLMAWINVPSFGGNYFIVDTSSSPSSGSGYSFRTMSNAKIRFWSYSATDNLIDSATTLAANTWYHIAVVHNSTQNKIYINGSLDATQNWTQSHAQSNTSRLRIGRSLFLGGAFNGNIDEVAFFNSDQSSNIATIYNSGVPNDLSSFNPVSWYRCGDGDTSPILTDNGTGGNDGTMTNFSTFSTDVPT